MKKNLIKSKLKKLITYNLGWKLLSLFLAMFLWFIVMNLINPTEIKTYTVSLSMLNKDKLEENNFVIVNSDELSQKKIEIKIRGTRTALDELSKKENKDNIVASIDLQQFELLYAKDVSNPISISVTPTLPSNLYSYTYQIVSYTPSAVEVKLDNVTTKSMPISIESVGAASLGYINGEPQIEPTEIKITGASNDIDRVAEVKAFVDISGATKSIKKNVDIVVLDEDGKKVDGITLSDSKVEVNVLVSKQGELQINEPEMEGTPAEGFYVSEIQYSPKLVSVISNSSNVKPISSIDSIDLPSINIDGITEDKSVVFDIRPYLKDTGLSLKNASDNEISVIVKIVKESQKEITVPAGSIEIKNLESGLTATVTQDCIINILGLEEKLNNLDLTTIKPSIDLTGLSVGTHSVTVAFELPPEVKLTDEIKVNVAIANETPNSDNNQNNNTNSDDQNNNPSQPETPETSENNNSDNQQNNNINNNPNEIDSSINTSSSANTNTEEITTEPQTN